MSIFSAIANAEHTFAAWVEKELTKLAASVPKIEQIADATLKYVGPALTIIASAAGGPAAGSIVSSVVAEAQKDLLAASGLIYDFGAHPTIASIVSSVQTNIGALLTDGHITDTTSVAAANKVVAELAALAAALSVPVAA